MNNDKTNSKDIFMELAKVKSEPVPIAVESSLNPFDAESEMEGQLTVDVYQTENDIVVQSTVAGVEPDDLDINITNESITIHGHRARKEEINDKDYFYEECFGGKFSRSIILPSEVDSEHSTAVLKNGVLIVRMPKLEKRKAKKLKIKID